MFRLGWALALLWAAPVAAQITHLSTFHWNDDHPAVKGVSGIEVSDDGTQFVAVTDFGQMIFGRMLRDQGQLRAVTIQRTGLMKAQSGRDLVRSERDAEGIAIGPDGIPVVAFERIHRVARFADPYGPAVYLGTLFHDPGLSGNSGLEALAVHPGGTLFAVAERAVGGRMPVYAFRRGNWTVEFHLDHEEGFFPVGADFGPDGKLYLLERRFAYLAFTSRIRVIDVTRRTDTVIWTSRPGAFDNLEALATWTDADGRIRLTLVSDDNDNWFQSTQIVELVLSD